MAGAAGALRGISGRCWLPDTFSRCAAAGGDDNHDTYIGDYYPVEQRDG